MMMMTTAKAATKIKTKTDTKKSTASAGNLHLKYVRSVICAPVKHKQVVRGLGFTRLNQVVVRPDTPAIRGMVAKVPHLVEIVQ
jgi:large subunit ribosomal protein L30